METGVLYSKIGVDVDVMTSFVDDGVGAVVVVVKGGGYVLKMLIETSVECSVEHVEAMIDSSKQAFVGKDGCEHGAEAVVYRAVV